MHDVGRNSLNSRIVQLTHTANERFYFPIKYYGQKIIPDAQPTRVYSPSHFRSHSFESFEKKVNCIFFTIFSNFYHNFSWNKIKVHFPHLCFMVFCDLEKKCIENSGLKCSKNPSFLGYGHFFRKTWFIGCEIWKTSETQTHNLCGTKFTPTWFTPTTTYLLGASKCT